MARRSSARLRSQNSSTPKRVSLSHDAPTRTPRTVPAKLSSLDEGDEMPGAFPRSASPKNTTPTAKRMRASTPKNVTPIQPSHEEMHPKQHQQTTAKPWDEARHLGFSHMAPHTAPPKQTSRIATLQATPTRAQHPHPNPAEDVKSPSYQFTFRREHSLELSPEAKQLMGEKREEAARIREQMVAGGEGSKEEALEVAAGRKMVTAKGNKKGRFSEVHTQQFQKMDSIAGHASAFRAEKSKAREGGTPQQKVESGKMSLKRSPSKAQLDDQEPSGHRTLHRSPSKPSLISAGSGLPRAASSYNLAQKAEAASSSPAKRVRRTEAEDVSATRPHSRDDDKPLPATPQQHKTLHMQPSYPDLSALTTPIQASLARAASVKSIQTSKIPAPFLTRSPSKPALFDKHAEIGKTPLLSRSPSKASLFSTHSEKPAAEVGNTSPLLARSPMKASTSKKPSPHEEAAEPKVVEAPLLSRSPLKMSVFKPAESEAESHKPSATPFLARSPSKIAMPSTSSSDTPNKSKSTTGLMGRFNLLRSSPMKSILRTPQRLYSDDPSKIAAGTHLTPPPKQQQPQHASDTDNNENRTLHTRPAATTPQPKRVDFTLSTKARQVESAASNTPVVSKSPTPPPEAPKEKDMDGNTAMSIDYPSLPSHNTVMSVSPSPQKRRQTITPGDFTFRAGDHGITFGLSPNATQTGAGREKRPSTIRHISADDAGMYSSTAQPTAPPTVQGSKKRKFEFENDFAVHPNPPAAGASEDKENAHTAADDTDEEPERPAKRTKSNPPPAARETSASPTKPGMTRLPTLGVKPKGVKSSVGGGGGSGGAGAGAGGGGKEKRAGGSASTISRERLNALAMPKRRG